MSDNRTFVSYSRADSEFALKLAQDLRALGAAVWLDQLDIAAGARWDSAIEDGLRRSARVLVLLSPSSVASQNVLDEVSFAFDEGKTIVPVLVEACPVPLRLRRLQHVDFTSGYDAAMNRLLATLGVAQGAPPPARATEPRSPVVHEPASLTPAPEAAAPGGRGVRLAIAGVVAVAVLVVAIVLWRPERSPDARVDAPADTAATSLERQAPVESPSSEGRLPASGSGLQALQALTRELGTQTTLSDPDLERLAAAESNACPNQAPTSACSTSARELVSAMLDTVCTRKVGAAPPAGSDTLLALKHESDMSLCRKPYTDVWLRRIDENARGAIRHIKPG